jgi:prephenate dehydrogenase
MHPIINSISIIGLGLIGGSIARAVRKFNPEISISAFDRHEVLNLAYSSKVIDHKLKSAQEDVNSDIIFLCLPTESSLKIFEQIVPLLKDGQILTDVCGVKGIFEEKWKSLSSSGVYIGGHPMTGKEKGGYENSDPLLFENSVYILSSQAKDFPQTRILADLITSLGARVRFLDPFIHDKIIARVSHLPQLLAVSLVNTVVDEKSEINYLDFTAGGFRDMTRIASGDFNIWRSVLKLNKEEVLSSIDKLISCLNSIRELLQKDEIKKIEEEFDNARMRRDEIPKNTKGFLNPLFDIFVYVKDEPGVLSKLTTVLFTNSINIKDIELLKIREGEGGTFRLSFESEEDASKAKLLIERSGFTTK